MIYFRLLATILLLTKGLYGFSQQEIDSTLRYISSQSLMQTTGFLASDRFKGRLQGTKEYDEAARYVAVRLKQLGLKPVGQESFLHSFEVETNSIERAHVILFQETGGNIIPLKLGIDFNCRGFSGSGKVNAPIVYTGYGLNHPELNDYDSVNVKGKIVLVYKGAPNWKPLNGSWGDVGPRHKARIAATKGAIALILMPSPNELQTRELIGSVACGDGPHLDSIPMIQITRSVADSIFTSAKTTYAELVNQLSIKKTSHSFHIPRRMSINVISKYRPNAPTYNVVAVWEGTHKKLKKEYIVLGAHLDHVGIQANTLLYPGANDNASGVAALIEIAKALKNGSIKTDRSILFVVFSAEESGMHGSRHFVANSPVNVKKIAAMVNFDCVAQGDSIAVGGKLSFPKTWNIVKKNDTKRFNLLSINTFGGGGADAEAFYRAGIPTLYFNTSGGYKHLHLESDRTETLNADLFEKLTQLGFITTLELSSKKYKKEKEKRKR